MNLLKSLIVFLFILAMFAPWPPASAAGPDPHAPANKADTQAPSPPLDLDRAVRLALEKSPYFVQSALEIDVRHLDESDSRYAFVPTFAMQTRYYMNPPFAPGTGFTGAVLEFRTGVYNPAEAYFSLKVRKLLTQLAVLAHMEAIDAGIYQLAQTFIKLNAVDQVKENLNQIADLTRQKAALIRERLTLGTASSTELKIAEQEEAMIRAELARLDASKTAMIDTLTVYLGLAPEEPLEVADQDGGRQALNGFVAETATEDRFLSHAFPLRMQDVREKLQDWQIILAYARFAPTLTFGLRNPIVEEDRDYYIEMVLTLPIWEGNKRRHDVSRQKLRKQQLTTETRLKKNDMKLTWRTAESRLKDAQLALDLARRAEELAELKIAEAKVLYASQGDLSPLLDARVALLRARQKRYNLSQERDLAVLEIRHLTGALFDQYVQVSDWQE